eukprot:100198-Pleurochrysis_carterae.AAC.1
MVPMMAAALASACTRGSATARSASGTDALTPSMPPPRRCACRPRARARAALPASPRRAAAACTART